MVGHSDLHDWDLEVSGLWDIGHLFGARWVPLFSCGRYLVLHDREFEVFVSYDVTLAKAKIGMASGTGTAMSEFGMFDLSCTRIWWYSFGACFAW